MRQYCVIAIVSVAWVGEVAAQSDTSFTFQGRLMEQGAPVNGSFDLDFALFDAGTGGLQIGSTASMLGHPVSDGFFAAALDFGPDAFDGTDRYVEVTVDGTPLAPRQRIGHVPYAIQTRGLFVDENLKVGIGTTAPARRLSVEVAESGFAMSVLNTVGGAAVFQAEQGRGIEVVTNGDNSTAFLAAHLNIDDGQGVGVEGLSSSDAGTGVLGRGGLFGVRGKVFGTTNYAGYFEGGRNYFEGNVGIGITDPQRRLHVTGGSGMTLTFGGYTQFGNTNSANLAFDDNEIMARNDGNASNLFLNRQGGNVGIGTGGPNFTLHVGGSAGKPGGGSWSNSSDRRLKKNIEPIRNALDDLLALRGVNFEYIDPESIDELPGPRIGMIAQEVERVFPDWVDRRGDGYKAVTYRGFEALAVEAIRELEAQNRLLRARLAELEKAVTALAASATEEEQ